MTLVASVEAAHQFGWERIKLATTALYIESAKASRAFERDNKVCYLFLSFSIQLLVFTTALLRFLCVACLANN